VGSVELVLADDELEALVAREELAQLHAALALRLALVLSHHLHPALMHVVRVLRLFGEVIVPEND
jgi:hypothetical protein